MTGLDRIVVLALGLSAASAGLATRAAAPGLRALKVGQGHEQPGQQVQHLLTRVVQNADRLDKSLDPSNDRDRTDDTRGRDEIRRAVNDFRQAAVWLRDRATGRQPSVLALEDVLQCGARINGLTQRHQLSVQAEQEWLSLRADLDRLARAHTMAWAWRTATSTAPPAVTEDDP